NIGVNICQVARWPDSRCHGLQGDRCAQMLGMTGISVTGENGTGSSMNVYPSTKRVRTGKAQGFALIDLIFVCGIIGLLCGIAMPRLLLAKQTAYSASAVGSMRAINSSQLTYALTCGNGFYAPNRHDVGPAQTR